MIPRWHMQTRYGDKYIHWRLRNIHVPQANNSPDLILTLFYWADNNLKFSCLLAITKTILATHKTDLIYVALFNYIIPIPSKNQERLCYSILYILSTCNIYQCTFTPGVILKYVTISVYKKHVSVRSKLKHTYILNCVLSEVHLVAFLESSFFHYIMITSDWLPKSTLLVNAVYIFDSIMLNICSLLSLIVIKSMCEIYKFIECFCSQIEGLEFGYHSLRKKDKKKFEMETIFVQNNYVCCFYLALFSFLLSAAGIIIWKNVSYWWCLGFYRKTKLHLYQIFSHYFISNKHSKELCCCRLCAQGSFYLYLFPLSYWRV